MKISLTPSTRRFRVSVLAVFKNNNYNNNNIKIVYVQRRRRWRACVRVSLAPACRVFVCTYGRSIITHSIQLVNTKPRSVCGMPRMAKRIRTTYRSGARIAWRTGSSVGVVAIGERVQRSHIAAELIVLVPHRRQRAASVAALRGNSVARNLDTLFPPSPLFPPLLANGYARVRRVCVYFNKAVLCCN